MREGGHRVLAEGIELCLEIREQIGEVLAVVIMRHDAAHRTRKPLDAIGVGLELGVYTNRSCPCASASKARTKSEPRGVCVRKLSAMTMATRFRCRERAQAARSCAQRERRCVAGRSGHQTSRRTNRPDRSRRPCGCRRARRPDADRDGPWDTRRVGASVGWNAIWISS